MRSLIIIFLFTTFSINAPAQCFDAGGNGDFEGEDALNQFVANTQGNGSFDVTSETSYTGSQSLKVDVTVAGNWQVRIFNGGVCYFDLIPNENYTVSFYMKGEIGKNVIVSIMDNTTVDQEQEVVISSSDWKLYTVTLKASKTSSSGRIKVIFKDAGVYFIDDLRLNAFDCNGDIGGTASLDGCGICSGGNTGVSPISDCSFQAIDPTNQFIVYEGVVEKEISLEKATLFRFTKDYATSEVSGFYQQKRAAASSGIKIRFKTSSPKIKAYFQENLTHGDDVFWHTFDVFRNGTFLFDDQGWEIEGENPTQEVVEWAITLPSYSMIEFLKLEIINGFELEPINKDKPVYIAIGNSITHGMGIDSFSTRKTYPHVVADSLGYELYNWGIGGSKIYEGILSNFIPELDPDLITILWGYNDVHYSGHDSYLSLNTFPKYETLIGTMAQNFPEACIMAVLSPYTTNPVHTDARTIDSLKSGQLEVIKKLQQTYSNLNFMDGFDYTGQEDLNDDVHLNSNGNKSLAYGIISELPCSTPTNTFKKQKELNPIIFYQSDVLSWKKTSTYSLIDFSGKIVASGEGNQVHINGFVHGIYFLKIGENFTKLLLN